MKVNKNNYTEHDKIAIVNTRDIIKESWVLVFPSGISILRIPTATAIVHISNTVCFISVISYSP